MRDGLEKLGDRGYVHARFRRSQLAAEDRRNVDHAVREAIDTTPVTGATAAGDARKLRGIPAIGMSVAGVITDTGELGALMAQRPDYGNVRHTRHDPLCAFPDFLVGRRFVVRTHRSVSSSPSSGHSTNSPK